MFGLIISVFLFIALLVVGLHKNSEDLYPNYMADNCKCNYPIVVYEDDDDTIPHCPNCGRGVEEPKGAR